MLARALRAIHGALIADWRREALPPILARFVEPGWRVLDVGCGDGRIAGAIRERVPLELSGVDVTDPVAPPPFPFRRYDGTALPFADRAFDAVLLIDVLHHTGDPDPLLREAARVARRRVLVKEHRSDGGWDHLRLRAMDWVGNRGYGVRLPYSFRPASEWRERFRRAGLEVEEEVDEVRMYPFPFGVVFTPRLHFVAALCRSP